MNRKEKREHKKDLNVLEEIVMIMKQYFPELIESFNEITDKRNQSYVKYEMKVIFIVRLMALICSIKSMNEISREFNTEEAIKNIGKICGLELEEIPHHDTISDVLEKVEIEELEKINKYIVNRLIRSKMLDKYRIRGKYFQVIVDGTSLAVSKTKYNDKCLMKNKKDKDGNEYKEYSIYVLEAKLVVGEMVISIGTEFVENKEDIEKLNSQSNEKGKQDCEINAFKRLVKRIKKEYPRLNIVISGDALYANSSVIEICKNNNWKYLIRFKEGTIPTVYRDFEGIVKNFNESKKEGYELATNLEYKEYKLNVIRYTEKKKGIETVFIYITDLPVSDSNIVETIYFGRKRWKIENEGFNMQKNGTFDIEHLYSKNEIAIKANYLLIQIAHTIRQLLEQGSVKINSLKLKIKEISTMIKKTLISKILNLVEHNKIQLRFTI